MLELGNNSILQQGGRYPGLASANIGGKKENNEKKKKKMKLGKRVIQAHIMFSLLPRVGGY